MKGRILRHLLQTKDRRHRQHGDTNQYQDFQLLIHKDKILQPIQRTSTLSNNNRNSFPEAWTLATNGRPSCLS
jgi:hypothetical protein